MTLARADRCLAPFSSPVRQIGRDASMWLDCVAVYLAATSLAIRASLGWGIDRRPQRWKKLAHLIC